MKNQNDMIISISVGVVALIVAAVIYFTAPQPTMPAQPAAVDTSTPKLPVADVTYTNGLSGGSNQMGGMGGPPTLGRGPMGGMGGPGPSMGMPGGVGAGAGKKPMGMAPMGG